MAITRLLWLYSAGVLAGMGVPCGLTVHTDVTLSEAWADAHDPWGTTEWEQIQVGSWHMVWWPLPVSSNSSRMQEEGLGGFASLTSWKWGNPHSWFITKHLWNKWKCKLLLFLTFQKILSGKNYFKPMSIKSKSTKINKIFSDSGSFLFLHRRSY